VAETETETGAEADGVGVGVGRAEVEGVGENEAVGPVPYRAWRSGMARRSNSPDKEGAGEVERLVGGDTAGEALNGVTTPDGGPVGSREVAPPEEDTASRLEEDPAEGWRLPATRA
jgi:hypothetical protein